MDRFFGKTQPPPPSGPMVGGRPSRVPRGVCAYAIGDLHGRADLLRRMHRLIRDDAALLPPGTERVVVYLGDYLDRGYESREVLERLIHEPLLGFHTVHLVGNHDAWMLGFLEDEAVGAAWLKHGGETTLASYGVHADPLAETPGRLKAVQGELRRQVPAGHLDFLESLDLYYELGDYLFVHAGVRPGVALAEQRPEDLLWIREPFLGAEDDFGKIVVHGHTVQVEPVVRPNRIGVDTGACWTDRLTCLVLFGTTYRFLAT